ncbi:hypothetical protein GCM10018790_10730 [Kitasatospora xanthocidica]|uniref:enterochelin esterase n=1 Tax=Kitasatospora xanthocidica TaxID=83382 RepID=UPI00198A33E2|nr:enterochelin esterase [Kitasatospora xanthocidica]GHF34870.1 hypothetical protein GCM10018790_10730 [Kitasatospora xanthocidica]
METPPLVAPDPDDPAYRLVTLVHPDEPYDGDRRDGDRCDGVLALLHTVTDKDRHSGDLAPHLMRRQADGCWSITYRLRADHRASYQLYPFHGEAPGTSRPDWLRVLDHARPDPYDTEPRLPARDGRHPSSVLSLPDAPAQPYVRRREGVPRGRTVSHTVAGRRVDVHLPAGHGRQDGGPYRVAVLLDGEMWGEVLSVADTLDNLTADGAIPPTVALLVHTMGPGRPADLSCNPDFVDLLADRLLPWAATEFGATTDPAHTVVAGQSAGGLTAAYAAYRRPDRFGNALSQSGSFWWPDETEFDEGSEWLTRRFAAEERRAARFYVEVGLQEWMLLTQNRHLRDVLLARGYDLAYREFNGGHDYACWRGGLADGLAHLLGARTPAGSPDSPSAPGSLERTM